MILVWLDGGPPQHETYDPKPEAPAEFRGPLKAMSTSVPGIQISELLPHHARMMDKMSIIRSMHHDNGDHFAAAHWMLTGYLGSNAANLAPQYPSAGSIVASSQGPRRPGMPAYVGLPNTHSVGLVPGYHGAAYLGVAYNPFYADGDPELRRLSGPQPRRFPPGVDARPARGPAALLDLVRPRPARRRRLGPDGRPRPVRAAGLHDGPRRRGPRRPSTSARKTRGSATATAATSGARARCWPAGWSRRACGS